MGGPALLPALADLIDHNILFTLSHSIPRNMECSPVTMDIVQGASSY